MRYAFRLLTIVSCILALGHGADVVAQTVKKDYELRGTVEKVDARSQKLTVNHEKVEGLMAAMTMSYRVDKAELLKTIKIGDRITATLRGGNTETLYDVQVVADKEKTPGK